MLVLVAVTSSLGQDSYQTGKNEICVTTGHTFVSDQTVPNSGLSNANVQHGNGISFEVDYTRILRTTGSFEFGIELPTILNPDEDLHYARNQTPRDYSSFFITPAARLRLMPALAFSPWLSFGGGFAHFEASSNLIYSGTNAGNRSALTGVLQGGVGFDAHIPWEAIERYTFRFEARDDWSGVPPINLNTGKSRQHNYYLGGGLAFRF